MRLIDADALIQKLYEMKAKEEQYIGLENDVSVMIGSIGFEVMNTPTAYDIDKVVKELYEERTEILFSNDYENEIINYCLDKFDGAIEIVEQGLKEQNK